MRMFLTGAFRGMCELIQEGRIWFKYTGEPVPCIVCKVPIYPNDQCRILKCPHLGHADCLARYSDRVKSVCPVPDCGVAITPFGT